MTMQWLLCTQRTSPYLPLDKSLLMKCAGLISLMLTPWFLTRVINQSKTSIRSGIDGLTNQILTARSSLPRRFQIDFISPHFSAALSQNRHVTNLMKLIATKRDCSDRYSLSLHRVPRDGVQDFLLQTFKHRESSK